MASRENSSAAPEQTTHLYTDLEAQLAKSVADFGLDELAQLLDAAEAIRRVRRL